jgi:hypothetical protein
LVSELQEPPSLGLEPRSVFVSNITLETKAWFTVVEQWKLIKAN